MRIHIRLRTVSDQKQLIYVNFVYKIANSGIGHPVTRRKQPNANFGVLFVFRMISNIKIIVICLPVIELRGFVKCAKSSKNSIPFKPL